MRRKFLSVLLILISIALGAQDNYFSIQKVDGNQRMKKVRVGANINFTRLIDQQDSLSEYFYARGKIKSISNNYNSITLRLEREEINTFWKDGYRVGSYEEFGYCRDELVSYNLNDIGSLQFTNPSRRAVRVFGINLMTISAISAAIIAPLVSVNFKEGTFNMDRYKGWLIGGLAGFGVSIPILVLSKPKQVDLKDKTGYDYKRWEIVE